MSIDEHGSVQHNSGEDLLAGLVDDVVDEVAQGQDVTPGPEQRGESPRRQVPLQTYLELAAHRGQLEDAAVNLRAKVLEARDKVADAEGDLAIAETKHRVAMRGVDEAREENLADDVAVVVAREDVAKRSRALVRAGRSLEALERRLDVVEAELSAAVDEVDEVDEVEPTIETEVSSEPPPDLFPSVYAFVPNFLAIVYARPVGDQITGFRWCSTWWEHPEAVSRLEALWKAFETLRQDPTTGAAVWWRDFADPTMSALCSPDGPFKQCSDASHKLSEDLPTKKAPSGLTDP